MCSLQVTADGQGHIDLTRQDNEYAKQAAQLHEAHGGTDPTFIAEKNNRLMRRAVVSVGV